MLKGSTSELLARLLEESDKAFGGTRLLTTQQLEGQQARGRCTQEFTHRHNKTPSAQPRCGWREQREQGAADTAARHRPAGGVCRVCVCTHTASFHHLRRGTQQHLIQKLILARLVAQNLAHAHVLLLGWFKQLQDEVPPPIPGRRMLFGGKKRNACKAERRDYLIFSAFVLYFVPSIKFLKLLISLGHCKNLQASLTANN